MIQSLFTNRTEANSTALESGSDTPFRVDYSASVLDAIRLAISSSLSRGSHDWQTVGGIFFGRQEGNRVVLTEAAGFATPDGDKPGAELGGSDYVDLQALLASPAERGDGAKAVGWYRSVRGELSFTESDLGIHRRFFPEPWQPLLLFKPDVEKPTRAAFFFPNTPGALRAGRSHEFMLERTPAAADAERSAEPQATECSSGPKPDPVAPIVPSTAADQEQSDNTRVDAAANTPAVARLDDADGEAAPKIPKADDGLAARQPANGLARTWVALGVATALCGTVVAGYRLGLRRSNAPPPPTVASRPIVPPAAALRLVTIEEDGQLQILWDPSAPVILSSRGGALTIADLDEKHNFSLDRTQLETGSFTYRRQGERVDVVLNLHQPDGHNDIQATVYFARTKPSQDSGGTDDRQLMRLKSDLVNQTRRADRLERLLGRARRELEKERQARVGKKR